MEPSTLQFGLAGIEKRADAVVLKVGKAKGDALESLDQIVEPFGGTLGEPGLVVGHDLFEPALQGPPEPSQLRGVDRGDGALDDLGEALSGLSGRGDLVELGQGLLHPVGQSHLCCRVPEAEQGR